MKLISNSKGQIILVLILVMSVALTIGLSVIQRSLSDISTSTKIEQSSRAFSAAEAGVERALRGETGNFDFSENNSSVQTQDSGLLPPAAAVGTQQVALAYPAPGITKESIGQVWLADYNSATNPPPNVYTHGSLDVYWGSSSLSPPAIQITVISYNSVSGQYQYSKSHFDPNSARASLNNFTVVSCSGTNTTQTIFGQMSFYCRQNISLPPNSKVVRTRFLYNSSAQLVAFQPPTTATCGVACSIPSQARVITSTGYAGGTQRRVQLFKQDSLVPLLFDYAIFSSGGISK